ncbi:MAG TPA: FAD-dependent oxidoreductase [Actinoplanes sp.]|nr:FAD-dependent oxidoreductase [Actinoplanes sp.]
MTSLDDGYLPRDHYEAVVIGSGFGGAVVACRLAQAGLDVAVVERGRRWPPGSFPRDLGRLDSGWLWLDHHGLYDIRRYGDMLCVQAAGYGGGSLVYANVAIRPPAEVFEQAWPLPYRRPFLDPYYDLAAHMLAIRPVPPDPRTGALPPKTQLMQLAADRLGRAESLFRPNLAVTFAGPQCPSWTEPVRRSPTCLYLLRRVRHRLQRRRQEHPRPQLPRPCRRARGAGRHAHRGDLPGTRARRVPDPPAPARRH